MDIWRKSGVKLEPNQAKTWDKLFDHLQLERSDSYKNEIIEATYKKNPSELLKDAFRVRRLASLKSKYFEKMPKHIVEDILYYSLFQLRAGEEEQGTVVGRYSATNFPIQTCFKVENQVKKYGEGYIIRELMIPDDGFDFFTADGSQLQFRLFAHLSQDKDLFVHTTKGTNVGCRVAKMLTFTRWLQTCSRFAVRMRRPTTLHL
jgi:DNA polymerase-1